MLPVLHCNEVPLQTVAQGHERPIWGVRAMSASPPKATDRCVALGDAMGQKRHFALRKTGREGVGLLSESVLLRVMFNVGYFPPNTPPAE
jgi:hypothetical protein